MNNYKKEYDELIEKVQKENRGIKKLKDHGKYFNIHHIVPRSIGGVDDDKNLVKLTNVEHFEAHRLLYYIYKNSGRDGFKMAKAFIMMSGKFTISAEDYAEAKKTFHNIGMSEQHRKRISLSQLGNRMHDNTRSALSKYHLGRKHSDESKVKMRLAQCGEKNPMFGKTHSQEARNILSLTHLGVKNHMYGKTHSIEAKDKMSLTKITKVISEENYKLLFEDFAKIDKIIRGVTYKELSIKYNVSVTFICNHYYRKYKTN